MLWPAAALQGAPDQFFGRVCTGTDRLEQASGLGRTVTQGDERGIRFRLGIRAYGDRYAGDADTLGRRRRISEAVTHLNHEALRGLTPDAGDFREGRDVFVHHAAREGL